MLWARGQYELCKQITKTLLCSQYSQEVAEESRTKAKLQLTLNQDDYYRDINQSLKWRIPCRTWHTGGIYKPFKFSLVLKLFIICYNILSVHSAIRMVKICRNGKHCIFIRLNLVIYLLQKLKFLNEYEYNLVSHLL